MAQRVERVTQVPHLPPRARDAHKGDVGRVLVVGGSQAMFGAPALAGVSALRAGAGLVKLAAPETVQPFVVSLCPCATSLPLKCDGRELSGDAVAQVVREAERNSVVAVGPGMGVGLPQRMTVQALIEQDTPLVIDADGLNNLANIANWAALRRGPVVLTPHPGEMARLTGRSVSDIQADREGAALSATREWLDQQTVSERPLVLVLKGAGAVVTDGRRLYVNVTGNPGLATGGAGDVLTGIVAALIGQGLGAFDAAVLATYVHGLAGDLAAEELGEVSLIASDLPGYLPRAFRRL